MKLGPWFRRPAASDDDTRPSTGPGERADDRVQEGADDLQATREAVSETLTALTTQLEASRGQWDAQTREAYDRMRDEWRSSLDHMDATIARVRGSDEG